MSVATFRALHHDRPAGDPLVLPGPWDATSARVFADAGFPALATPSRAVTESLGYEDGGLIPPGEMFAAIRRIAGAVDIPVSADVEHGYGLPPCELVERLLDAGVVGCNLEDTAHPGTTLRDAGEQADFLAAVRAAAGEELFVNARIDTFAHGDKETGPAVERGRRYAEAGADCVYPILCPPGALRALADGIGLPVNALALPDGPAPHELGHQGATRVTFGPGLHRRATAALRAIAAELGGAGAPRPEG
ncbi:isocitrate lyase/PEP mutase family protein [Streptomyces sp. SBT349]|uniref:isocitrate lyase/PEP mutase family protein n=1 Tax=Streptomyces sp. SBT349 TaxID=1580539 RepID=UPI00066E2C04|nr:isocitrate lyase/phosphoenolpyruvate mutase family protein [Streptomyces sp. SBT349]